MHAASLLRDFVSHVCERLSTQFESICQFTVEIKCYRLSDKKIVAEQRKNYGGSPSNKNTVAMTATDASFWDTHETDLYFACDCNFNFNAFV